MKWLKVRFLSELLNLLAVLTVSIIFYGCSIITYDKHYFPTVPDDNSAIYSDFEMGAHTVFDTTPKETVIFANSDLRLEVTVYTMDALIVSAGPLYFPIIPTFPIDMIAEPIYKYYSANNWIYDHIIINVTANNAYYDFKCDLNKIKIILSDGTIIKPSDYTLNYQWGYQPDKSIRISDNTILTGWCKRNIDNGLWMNLHFPISKKSINNFTLKFDDSISFTKDNGTTESLSISGINFQWDSGFRMLIGP